MASPFEQAWMLLKMPLNNPGYGDDHPAMEEPQPPKFSDYEPTDIPPELQYKQPSNLVSPTGRLGDIPLDERGIREMRPVPPSEGQVQQTLPPYLTEGATVSPHSGFPQQ